VAYEEAVKVRECASMGLREICGIPEMSQVIGRFKHGAYAKEVQIRLLDDAGEVVRDIWMRLCIEKWELRRVGVQAWMLFSDQDEMVQS